MASTSCVRLLSAITVGSLRTMPRPRAYTRVLAVPRSMARSLARPALPLVVLGWLRRQRLQLAPDLRHTRAAFGGDGGEAGHDLLLVRLVLEAGHTGATLGVVTHCSREHHDGSAVGTDGPPVRDVDRQRLGRERQPVVTLARDLQCHAVMLEVTSLP